MKKQRQGCNPQVGLQSGQVLLWRIMQLLDVQTVPARHYKWSNCGSVSLKERAPSLLSMGKTVASGGGGAH